jgi:hypothetical protein
MLDAHDSIAVTPETHFGERYIRKPRDRDGSSPENLLEAFCQSAAFRRMGIDERSFRASMPLDPKDEWRPLRLAMHAFARRSGATVVGEKTPGHALHLAALARAFPEARFLLLRRDPRAVAASWLRTSWSRETTVEVAEKWRRYSRAMRDASRAFPGRCLEIRYESLVANPEPLLESVCAFLDVEFDPQMLLFYEREREAAEGAIPQDEGADNVMTFAPLEPKRIDAWRDQLASRDRRRIEFVCGQEMVREDYPRESTRRARLTDSIGVLPFVLRQRTKRGLRRLRMGRT